MAIANVWAWLFLLCLVTSCHTPIPPQQAVLASSDAATSPQATAMAKIAAPIRDTIQRLMDAAETSSQPTASYTHPLVRVDASGRIQTDILVTSVDAQVVSALRASRVQVEQTHADQQTVQGWIPFDRVEAVAALPFVRYIRPPRYATRR